MNTTSWLNYNYEYLGQAIELGVLNEDDFDTKSEYKVCKLLAYSRNHNSEVDYKERLSQLIIINYNEIVPFFENYKDSLENKELYWKQNMPYYKKEE